MRIDRVYVSFVLLASAAVVINGFGAACAAPVQYTIDPTLSTFGLTGTFDGAPLNEQMPGSRTVGYGGVLQVDVDHVAGKLSFPTIVTHAGDQPTDQFPSAPRWTTANYGFTALGGADFTQLAIRGMGLYFQGNALPFNSGAPNPDSLAFFVSDGELRYYQIARDHDVVVDLHGLGGAAKTVGPITLATSGNVETLTIPLTSTFAPFVGDTGKPINLTLSGQLVATRLVPEPAGAATLAACLGAGLIRRRRKAR